MSSEPDKFSELRKKAAKILNLRAGEDWTPFELSLEEAHRLIEELHTHQIELELQNEELRRAQLELTESHNRYLDLYDFAPVGYLTLSKKGMIQAANLSAASLFNVERQVLINAPLSQFVHGGNQDRYYLFMNHVFETPVKHTCEIKMTKKGGLKFDARLECVAVPDEDGRLSQCRIALFDITESESLKEALRVSHRFLELANEAYSMDTLLTRFIGEVQNFSGCDSVGIRILDKEGNIPYQAYAGFDKDFYGSESPLSIHSDRCMCINVVKGNVNKRLPFITDGGSFFMNGTTRFLATVPPEERGTTRNVCNKYGYETVALIPIKTGEDIRGLVHIADHRNDMIPPEMVWMLEKAALQLGSAIERVKTKHELEESESRYRQLAELQGEEITEKAAQLQKAEKMASVGRMVSIVAHEVRNPLQNIQMGVDALRKRVGDDIVKLDILGEIDYGVNVLNQTVRELLDYSKQLNMQFATLPLRDIIDQAMKLLSGKLEGTEVHLKLDSERSQVSVDPVKFVRVFTNLMANAIEAMPGSGDIWICSRPSEKHGTNAIAITISDSGCGIEEKNLDKIYEPFFTTKTRGTGLGIPACMRIIEAHGGSLNIRSKIGEGTTVEIELPARSGLSP